MSTSNDNQTIKQTAREWLVRLYADTPDEETKTAFRNWLEQDQAHHQAFLQAETLWNDVGLADLSPDTLSLAEDKNQDKAPEAKSTNRFWPTTIAASVAGFFVATFLTLATQPEGIDYSTKVGEQRTISLTDGSEVTLGAETSMHVVMSSDERLILLKQGQARFDVTHNPQAPFTVDVANTTVKVLGTTFDIRLGENKADVSVMDGNVGVRTTKAGNFASIIHNLVDEPAPLKVLHKGQRVSANFEGKMSPISAFSTQAGSDWTQGRFVYDGAALAEIIKDINRYRSEKISIQNPKIKQLKITTSFNISQADQVLEGLAMTQSLRLEKTPEGVELTDNP